MPDAFLLIAFVGMVVFLVVFAAVVRGMLSVVTKPQDLSNLAVERISTPVWVMDQLAAIDRGERLKLVGAQLEGIPALRCNACGQVDPRLVEFCDSCGARLLEEHRAPGDGQRILG